jgi:endonuclease/exonuclease/phosphatase family metal-dependent hydrolase
MPLRIATFNVNNLFKRAALLQLEGFSLQSAAVLDDIVKLQQLLAKPNYTGTTASDIKDLLTKYDFHKNTKKPWFTINEMRGRLFRVKQNPARIELVAAKRADWVGGIELVRELVPVASTDNTARVIQAVRPDVLCVVEAEDRTTLDQFNDKVLKLFHSPFAHNMLIDGNDDRGIDVGLYTNFELGAIHSHIDDTYMSSGRQYRIFSRDCPEYEVRLPNGKSLWVLCNHLKSQGYGTPASNNKKRKRQADRVRELLGRFDLKVEFVAVAGDLNDKPDSAPLADLLATPHLFDVLDSPLLGDPRWTYGGNQQLDYLLVSKALKDHLAAVGIEQRGIFRPGCFPEVTSKATQASDHACVWAEFNLP